MAEIKSQHGFENFRALINLLPECRFGPPEFRAHVHILRALA